MRLDEIIFRLPEDGAQGAGGADAAGSGGGEISREPAPFEGVAAAAIEQYGGRPDEQFEQPQEGVETTEPAQEAPPAEQAQQQEAQPFSFKYRRGDQEHALTQEQLTEIIDQALDVMDRERQRQDSARATQAPKPQPKAPQPGENPMQAELRQLKEQLAETQKWQKDQQSKEERTKIIAEIDRAFSSEEPKHQILKDHPSLKKGIRQMALGYLQWNTELPPGRAYEMAVKEIAGAFQAEKAKYATQKIQAGQQVVERAGGVGARPAAKQHTGEDLMSGKIAKEAIREMQLSSRD